jgi:hypothetical protein
MKHASPWLSTMNGDRQRIVNRSRELLLIKPCHVQHTAGHAESYVQFSRSLIYPPPFAPTESVSVGGFLLFRAFLGQAAHREEACWRTSMRQDQNRREEVLNADGGAEQVAVYEQKEGSRYQGMYSGECWRLRGWVSSGGRTFSSTAFPTPTSLASVTGRLFLVSDG